jgi:hypothetical protein
MVFRDEGEKMITENNKSEVAQFRHQQALEEEAAQRGLNGFAIVARHESITARMEIGAERLLKLIEEGKHEEAQAMMNTPTWGVETLADLPDPSTRSTLVDFLQRTLDHTEETTLLIERIQEMWQTMSLLGERFGLDEARKMIDAPEMMP